MRITVIGCGYLGVTHAACLAELGFEVLGVEVDTDRLATLQRGELPFFEPGLPELLGKHVASGRLRFTDSHAEAAAFGDLHFLCVGTPQLADGNAADLSWLERAVDSLAAHLDRPTLVVGKSTVPVGTAAALQERLVRSAPAGTGVELAWNPEFLREGYAIRDTLTPDRLVFGIRTAEAEKRLREVYATPLAAGIPAIVTDYPTAELVKVAANSFLATKISFINAMADLCEATGADVALLADAIGHDNRIGRRFLNAGIGFGGGCLPKDIRAFQARAEELGVEDATRFLHEIDAINQRRRARVAELATEIAGADARIAVLGAAFKPQSDDIRDSPALWVAATLQANGAEVVVHDPEALHAARIAYPTLGYAESPEEACRGADLVLHLTEWPVYRALDPARLGDVVRQRRIIDGRNCLDVPRWRAAGWQVRSMGRP